MSETNRDDVASGRRGRRKPQLRLAVALPFVTGLLTFGVAVYAFQAGRSDATSILSARDAARVWATSPHSWWWLVGLTAFGTLIGLAIAVAFTRQLHTLARRTRFLAQRNFSFPVDLETDGEVAPLVQAINGLLQSVRDYARHSVADGAISFSRDGRILAINPRAAVALGVDAESVLGRSFEALVPDVPENREIIDALVRAFDSSEPFDLTGLTWFNSRGQTLSVDLHGTVLAGEESIVSVLVVFDETPDLEGVQREVSRAHRLLIIGSFAAELAHEIRNPLSSVVGLVDLLRERIPEGDPGHRHLDVLSRAADRIEGLVGQLLDLVPTEMQDLERCDVNALVDEAVELVRMGQAGRSDVVLDETYAADAPELMVDPDRISRVVENLLRNAYAHTPDGGRIDVIVRGVEEAAEVEVHNSGSYIPPEEREQIFQPFVSGRTNGTGLGLAIARQIVYAHGGSLEVHSDEEEGTSFVVRLPVAPGQAEEPDVGEASPTTRELVAGVAP
ncbi:MAG: two-component system sensor histidine kinase NtrB [Acidobacteriota bacterium]